MKRILAISLIFCCWLTLGSQPTTNSQPNEISETSKEFIKWLGDLYEFGVQVSADSITITAEIQNVINNEALRNFLYPETYQWQSAIVLLNRMELKRALWFLINLYPDYKELVMKSIIKYDHLFEMDHALLSAFYTYAIVDPEVCSIIDGKPFIERPDLVEQKLRTVKEMIEYVLLYRSQREQKEK